MFTLRQIILIVAVITLPGSAFGQLRESPATPAASSKTAVEEEVVKIPEPIPDPSAGDAFQKLPVTDQFDALRVFRNKLVYSMQILTTQLQSVDAQLRDLLQTKKSQEEERPYSLPYSKDSLLLQQKALTDKINNIKQKLSDTAKNKLTQDQITALQQQNTDTNEQLSEIGIKIDGYDNLKTRIDQLKQENESLKRKTDESIVSLRLQQTKGIDVASKLNRQLSDSDEKIANLFGRSDASNDFKKIMSVVFAGLVALVIIGFFVIAFRDESVRKAIFSNESGIQFITLFALVIAIILFGIVQVLEGKELAALLGGLSGYILGRGTAKPA